MGWNSANEIFDPVATMVVKAVEAKAIAEKDAQKLLSTLIGKLQEMDWDTESESLDDFADHAFVVAAFEENGIELEDAGPDVELIKQAILDFSWGNYGLDEVENTESDAWSGDLAAAIANAIS